MPDPEDLLVPVAALDGVAAHKGVVLIAEHGPVEEAVLAPDVHELILNGSAGEDQFVPRLVSQGMHRLGLLCVVGLDPLALIADDHVGIVLLQRIEDTLAPCGLVVDHGHPALLEAVPLQIAQGLQPLPLVSQERPARDREGRILIQLLRPDRHHRCGSDHEDPLDHLLLPERTHDGDGRQGFA